MKINIYSKKLLSFIIVDEFLATEAKSRESLSLCGCEEEDNYLILIQSLKSEQKLGYVERFPDVAEVTEIVK